MNKFTWKLFLFHDEKNKNKNKNKKTKKNNNNNNKQTKKRKKKKTNKNKTKGKKTQKTKKQKQKRKEITIFDSFLPILDGHCFQKTGTYLILAKAISMPISHKICNRYWNTTWAWAYLIVDQFCHTFLFKGKNFTFNLDSSCERLMKV